MATFLTFSTRRAARIFLLMLAPSVAPIVSAQAQDFGERSRKPQFPEAEKHPTVSEKDYKAALEKIPPPTRKYDPWGVARPPESGRSTKKTD